MPVLDLPDLTKPHGGYVAQIALRTVMAWPTDATMRRRYAATIMAHHLGELEAAADGLPDLAQAADWLETLAAIREHEDWQCCSIRCRLGFFRPSGSGSQRRWWRLRSTTTY